MRKGDPASEKAYDENPLDLAKRFEDHGIDVIHLVDLDGAERGSPKTSMFWKPSPITQISNSISLAASVMTAISAVPMNLVQITLLLQALQLPILSCLHHG